MHSIHCKLIYINHSQFNIVFYVIGNLILHSTMAVEKLGSRQNSSVNDGFGLRYHIRSRKTTKEETATGLPLLKPQKS